MERYDNPRKVADVYLDILLDLPATSGKSSASFKTMHDSLRECIEGLNNVGVEFNEPALLTRLCLRKLDTESLKTFEQGLACPKELPTFQLLLDFLEARHLLLDTLDDKKSSKSLCTNYVQERNIKCILCDGDHLLFQCKKFADLNVQKRSTFVQKKNLCRNCISHKASKKCMSKYACSICNKNHHTLLHFKKIVKPENISNYSGTSNEIIKRSEVSQVIATQIGNKNIILSTALIFIKSITGRYEPFRALVDPGSQASLISENAAQILGLPRLTTDIDISGVGTGVPKKIKHKVIMEIRPHFRNKAELQTSAYILPKLTGNLPSKAIYDDSNRWNNIMLADPEYAQPGSIDVLLGADVYGAILLKGLRKGNPTAIQTKLGWILNGPIKTDQTVNEIQTHVSLIDINESITRFWTTENVSSSTEVNNDDEIYKKLYVNRDINGRYIVNLPFKNNSPKLGESRRQAVARFLQVEKSLESQPMKKQLYHDFMKEYLQYGHMIPLKDVYPNEGYYLPHHAVVNMDKSTTKLRVVFDASAKTSNGVSLNEELMIGPSIQDNLNMILMRWRTHQFVFTADVEKMYRQIKVQEDHQKYQKILWRFSKSEPIQDFALTTVTYGTAAAPYTAMRVLKQIADDTSENDCNKVKKIIKQDFYMDDLMSGANTEKEAISNIHIINRVMKSAGFTLRKWAANNPSLLQDVPEEYRLTSLLNLDNESSIKMLGVWWNPNIDSFSYKISIGETKQRTKRIFLSKISKIFDPLGWLAPITVTAKLMMQEVWASGKGWDDELSELFQQRWKNWENDLPLIEKINIPRHVLTNDKTHIEIHGFSDASERAYAASVYIRVKDNFDNYSIFLLGAKTRVAPLNKEYTIPRLELCGAVLLVNYINEIKNVFQKSDDIPIYYWTDSTITLAWIKGEPSRWKSFIAHRVAEIQRSSKIHHWFYVNTKDNPADIASRGIKPNKIIDNQLWWHGPNWLQDDWKTSIDQTEFITKEEAKNIKEVNILNIHSNISNLMTKFSSLGKLIRVMAYLKRFKNKSKGNLSKVELDDATLTVVKLVQQSEYTEDIHNIKSGNTNKISGKLLQLSPYIDNLGILRVGGRLENLKINSVEKHPIILPASNHFSKLLVNHAHLQTLHGGNQLTLAYIRQSYWITNAKCLVKRVIHNCVKCFKFKAETAKQLMGSLPVERINPAPAFTNTGIDYAGPIDIRVSKGRGNKSYKGFIAVFVCMATRAVHLEAVSDLTADAFIAAYKRFISRRGNCLNIYSDNGTNFVGAYRKMNKEFIDCTKMASEILSKNIETNKTIWHFIPPKAPHYGGIWEAAVKSMKHHLKRVIGEQKLTFEEMTTVLTQIEACLNSRPIIQMSNDPSDIEILTPGHFLIGRAIISDPQPTFKEMDYGSRWKLLSKMVQDFWKVWSNEYLSKLQQRPKWLKKEKNIGVGDLVLIKEDNLPPTRWAMGRIVETHPGKDGLVRAVTLRGPGNTILKRPITKLCPFPIHHDDIFISNHNNDLDDVQSNVISIEDHKIKSRIPVRNWMRGKDISYIQEQAKELKQMEPKNKLKRKSPRIRPVWGAKWLLLSTMICCFVSIMSHDGIQQFSINKFEHQPGIYFEEIGKMRFQRNEWNLIIHYNLKTYKESITLLKNSLIQLEEVCHFSDALCMAIKNECQHLMYNIETSDFVLQNSNKETKFDSNRQKRGLINGIGYLANELFGILDERSATKYETEIYNLQQNQHYVLELAKNHTSITDATLNLFKTNTEYMNEQLQYLNETIKREIKKHSYNGMVLKLTVAMIRIQELQRKILDIILDTHHGKFNPYLLSPTQLTNELKIIKGYIPASLLIPDIMDGNLADLYNLMTVKTRLTMNNIIFSVKIPLPDIELHEIFKLIPLPITYKDELLIIIPSSEYLIINDNRDHYYPINDVELALCSETSDDIRLCKPHNPIFNSQSNESKCEVSLINHKNDYFQYCQIRSQSKTSKWIQLLSPNTWIYAMNDEFPIDISCNSRIIKSTNLKGQGIVHLKPGCVLKQNGLTIAARNTITSDVESNFFPLVNSEQVLNQVEKQNINGFVISSTDVQNKLESLQKIVNQQQRIEAETIIFKQRNVHHFTMTYILLIIGILFTLIFFIWHRRTIKLLKDQIQLQTPQEATTGGDIESTV